MITHRTALVAIFAVAFALLVDEIMLSAVFHVLLGAGNTVAAIAIALVGLSAGGIVAYGLPVLRDPTRAARFVETLLFAFAVALLASVYAIMAVPISHGDLVYHSADTTVQLWRLAVYHVTVLPFFLGGIAISALLRSDPLRVGRLYSADLFGAAAGCAVSPALLSAAGAPGAILMSAVPAAALGSLLVARQGGARRGLWLLPTLLLLAGALQPSLLSFRSINTMGEVNAPSYRRVPIEPGDIEYERWALDAWTIIRGAGMPQQWENFRGWGLSPTYRGPIPETRLINYNARFSTYVTRRDGDPQALDAWIDADLSSLHYRLGRSFRSVLNIGAGGGREVLAALRSGAERVVAVDVSAVVVEDIMKGYLRDFSGGLYLDPRVEAIADEGRSFAGRTHEYFDLIEFSIVGGMNLEKMDLVRVDDLFTAEALRSYLERLQPEGIFSYVMYSMRSDLVTELAAAERVPGQPYIPALRTLAGLRMALEALKPGARFSDHVLAAALPGVIDPRYDLVHIVVSMNPLSAAERARHLEACQRLAFPSLYPSEPGAPENLYARIATSPDLASVAEQLPFWIRPATDDRPFQYALGVEQIARAIREGDLIRLLSDNPLVSMGLTVSGLAAILTLTPLLLGTGRRKNLRAFRSTWSLLLYFACIGFGYMAVEIAVLLRLQSYLGKPIYGLSVALFAFLLASASGSYFTNRLLDSRIESALTRIVSWIVVLGLAFVVGSPALFHTTIAAPLPARIAISMVVVFPLAFPMGMLFPIGVRLLARDHEDVIPWAWATNGCFSVLGIFSTRIIALLFGFSRALVLGLVAYLVVIACVRLHAQRSPSRAVSPAA